MPYQVLVGLEFKEVESLWKGVYLTKNSGGIPIRDALAGYIRDTDFAKELIKGFKAKDLLDALLCNAGHYNYTEGITHNPMLISETLVCFLAPLGSENIRLRLLVQKQLRGLASDMHRFIQ